MNTLKIKVKSGVHEIEYEQTVVESRTFSATAIEGYSKGNGRKELCETLQVMCQEVVKLRQGELGL